MSGGCFVEPSFLVPCAVCGHLTDWCHGHPDRKVVQPEGGTICFPCQDGQPPEPLPTTGILARIRERMLGAKA